MLKRIISWCFAFALSVAPCFADSLGSVTGGTAGTQSNMAGGVYNSAAITLSNGQQVGLQVDTNGNLKTTSSGGGGAITCAACATSALQTSVGATAHTDSVQINTTLGTPAQQTGATVGLVAGAAAIGFVGPSQRTLVTLDIKTVTTGGAAVAAISAGHRTAGGFLQNPKGATIDLCINEIGTATGTTSSGDTTCIPPGGSYKVAPASTAVSVITSDSSHPFSGYGLN